MNTEAKNTMTIAIVAGEYSGDNYGAMLINKLKLSHPNIEFIGVGGQKMQSEGLKLLLPMDVLSVMGIFNIIKNIPEILRAKRELIRQIIKAKPVLFIGIDAPDFNLLLAKNLKKEFAKLSLPLKTIQYISPTIWAWRSGRIKLIAKFVDLVLCIFPFEEQIYTKKNVFAKFVGHPLANKLNAKTKIDRLNSLNKIFMGAQIDSLVNKKIIGVFPGSRSSELNSLAPIFIATMKLLYEKEDNYHFVVPIVSEKLYILWTKFYYDNNIPVTIVKTYEQSSQVTSVDVMRISDVILCASGTTTLESFLVNTPMVVAYKVSKLNEIVLRLLLKINYVAMPNILSDMLLHTSLVPEYLQQHVKAENLSQAIISELARINDSSYQDKWQLVRDYLKSNGVCHEQAVLEAVNKLLQA